MPLYLTILFGFCALVLSLMELYLPRGGTKKLWQKYRVCDTSILRRLFPFKESKEYPFTPFRLIPTIFFSYGLLLVIALYIANACFSFLTQKAVTVFCICVLVIFGLYLLYIAIYITVMEARAKRQLQSDPFFIALKQYKKLPKKRK